MHSCYRCLNAKNKSTLFLWNVLVFSYKLYSLIQRCKWNWQINLMRCLSMGRRLSHYLPLPNPIAPAQYLRDNRSLPPLAHKMMINEIDINLFEENLFSSETSCSCDDFVSMETVWYLNQQRNSLVMFSRWKRNDEVEKLRNMWRKALSSE